MKSENKYRSTFNMHLMKGQNMNMKYHVAIWYLLLLCIVIYLYIWDNYGKKARLF